jgi:predicted MFS family arabinose efflux permease
MNQNTVLALTLAACVMFSGFIVIPNIAAFVQKNMGLPREELSRLYFFGGIASLIAMQTGGRITDRIGAVKTVWAGTIFVLLALIPGFMRQDPGFSAVVVGVLFMTGTSIRAIAFNTLTSKIPAPNQRGAFMSLQSTVQHLASAAGAFASSRLLVSDNDGKLIGMPLVAAISVVVSLAVPLVAQVITANLSRKSSDEEN